MATAVVTDLWRWPVLGMLGERLASTRIEPGGVVGDRLHAVHGPRGALSNVDLPRLGEWSATYPFSPGGAIAAGAAPFPTVTDPRGRHVYRWGDPWLRSALERDLGRTLQTVRDLHSARGVTVAAELPGDPGRSGINVQLRLEEPAPDGGWAGTVLRFERGVALELVTSAAEGPGIEARVLEPGRVRLQERVFLGC